MTDTATRPSIPAERFGQRLEAAARIAGERGLGALLIGVGPDLRYLTGYAAMPLERLTMLVVRPASRLVMVHTAVRKQPRDPCIREENALWRGLVQQLGN